MGMSTHIRGVRDLDGKFAAMMRVKLACDEAGVGYPDDVSAYFQYPSESEEYLRLEMEEMGIHQALSQVPRDFCDVFEIDLSKLPEGVKKIRVINSY